MRRAIESVQLSAIGCVNQAAFWASRGRVVLYRFHGLSGVLLTVTGPDAPAGKTLSVSYLTDGDDYIVLASGTEIDELTALQTATCATAEFSPNRHVPIDITTLSDDAERASLLKRLLRHASLYQRHQIRRHYQFPIVRLTPHQKPIPQSSIAFSGIWVP
ncbi:hypothetical protein [Nonomuraea rhodomycinica]|uniref:Uncharacterized protein n=1 Tax=Nonomuraea rhodomycinica TaxID=1712872 RepID=A0A7Y6INW1_9ACTN|nr:hypothetical protein [Nonomuraea rhodomycinica]NUW41666.1 hypothetical protein [Nonomuraea rhodomycinica]